MRRREAAAPAAAPRPSVTRQAPCLHLRVTSLHRSVTAPPFAIRSPSPPHFLLFLHILCLRRLLKFPSFLFLFLDSSLLFIFCFLLAFPLQPPSPLSMATAARCVYVSSYSFHLPIELQYSFLSLTLPLSRSISAPRFSHRVAARVAASLCKSEIAAAAMRLDSDSDRIELHLQSQFRSLRTQISSFAIQLHPPPEELRTPNCTRTRS